MHKWTGLFWPEWR